MSHCGLQTYLVSQRKVLSDVGTFVCRMVEHYGFIGMLLVRMMMVMMNDDDDVVRSQESEVPIQTC